MAQRGPADFVRRNHFLSQRVILEAEPIDHFARIKGAFALLAENKLSAIQHFDNRFCKRSPFRVLRKGAHPVHGVQHVCDGLLPTKLDQPRKHFFWDVSAVINRRLQGVLPASVLGLQTQCGVNFFILDLRRVLAPAPKVLGPKHISNPDFAPFDKKGRDLRI